MESEAQEFAKYRSSCGDQIATLRAQLVTATANYTTAAAKAVELEAALNKSNSSLRDEKLRADDAIEKVEWWSREATEIAAGFEREMNEQTNLYLTARKEWDEEMSVLQGSCQAAILATQGFQDRAVSAEALLAQVQLNSEGVMIDMQSVREESEGLKQMSARDAILIIELQVEGEKRLQALLKADARICELEAIENASKESMDAMLRQRIEMEARLARVTDENILSERDLMAVTAQVKRYYDELEGLKKQLNSTIAAKTTAEIDMEQWKSHAEATEKELSSLQHDVAASQQNFNAAYNEIEGLKMMTSQDARLLQEAATREEEQTAALAAAIKSASLMTVQAESNMNQLIESKRTISDLECRLRIVMDENLQSEQDLATVKGQCKKQYDEHVTIKKQLDNVMKTNAGMSKDMDSMKTESKRDAETIAGLNARLFEVTNELSEAKKNNLSLTAASTTAQLEMEILSMLNKKLSDTLSILEEDSEKRERQLMLDMQRARADLQSAHDEVEGLKVNSSVDVRLIAELQADVNSQATARTTAETRIRALEMQGSNDANELMALKLSIAALESRLRIVIDENLQSEQDLVTAKGQSKELYDEIARASKNLYDTEHILTNQNAAVNAKQDEVNYLRIELTEVQSALGQALQLSQQSRNDLITGSHRRSRVGKYCASDCRRWTRNRNLACPTTIESSPIVRQGQTNR